MIKISLFALILAFLIQHPVMAQEAGVKPAENEDETKSALCGGVERWAVKVLTDAAAAQVNYTPKPTTIDSLVQIPTTPNQNAPRMAGIEFQSYVFTCNITIKKNESDNDYHLVLKSGSRTMIGEVPDPEHSVFCNGGNRQPQCKRTGTEGGGDPVSFFRINRFSHHLNHPVERKIHPGIIFGHG